MSNFDFLVEIGTEELPPKALKSLSEAFELQCATQLQANNIAYEAITVFAAPRRLALWVKGLAAAQPDEAFERKGPAAKAAYDAEGNPSRAAMGFATSCGVTFADLETIDTPKGEWLVYRGIKQGSATVALLPDLIKTSLDNLPIAKRMRWGSNRFEFVRPLQWLVMLADDKVIPCEIMGITSGNQTRGHRFHSTGTLTISRPSDYEKILREQGFVIASFGARRNKIQQTATAIAAQKGLTVVIPDALLDEVTGLNEWPVALLAQFEERFLSVPSEALISSMEDHQKYFHTTDQAGAMQPYFVFIANIESKDPSRVIAGNEKVIRPRLADAAFFWETDKALPLAQRVARLDTVTFQKELGTPGDKRRRLEKLASAIATRIGSNPEWAARAAMLAKADLVTDMVGEFPELQGIAGSYYALHDGEPAEVAQAIREHYLPAGSGDPLPESATGIAVAMADRLDNLTGLFGIGQPPTGTRDPFALRRAALGLIRILVEKRLDLDITELLDLALAQHTFDASTREKTLVQVTEYILDRFGAWYNDDGIATEVIQSVRFNQIVRPMDFDLRVKAVHAFSKLPEAAALAAANKRVGNLLSKVALTDLPAQVDPALFSVDAERVLFAQIETMQAQLAPLVAQHAYADCLARLATLRAGVDQFFDDVMVMADDAAVRNNRLALLKRLRDLFLQVADISYLS